MKWWVTEEYSDFAVILIREQFRLVAPDLLLLELGNVLLKKVRLGEISPSRAATALAETTRLTEIHASEPLVQLAFELAVEFRQTMYDATYVALALSERCPLVTADRRLFSALTPHFKDTMLWIADLPEAR